LKTHSINHLARQWGSQHWQRFRLSLHKVDALPQLTFVGIIIGLVAGGLVVGFRLLIDSTLYRLLPIHIENFEALSPLHAFLFPLVGATSLAIIFYYIPKKHNDLSVGYVLERFHNYQGNIPLVNVLLQFFTSAISLISGQSVGREGPAVYLGAGIASALGRWCRLPHNSLRTLIGCGVAAAIAASFNTPIAGVIFAMEVVLMSYSIVGFIPIMMASVCGALITRIVFGEDMLFTFSGFAMHGLWELSLMVAVGFIIGIVATIYMRLQLAFMRFSHFPVVIKIMLAGLLTSCSALVAPEILGLGYDTVNLLLNSHLAIYTLCIILAAKIIVTSFSVAMGIPGGLIGPQLFIGACAGAIVGTLINGIFPDSVSNTGFYVLLGMAAMMGAVINAPLAALMAVLELTYNPSLIFPSMLIIVVSCITTRLLFKCDGIFIEQLRVTGKSLDTSPSQQILSSIGVASVMNTTMVICEQLVTVTTAKKALIDNPLWIVIRLTPESTHVNSDNANNTIYDSSAVLLKAADLATYISQQSERLNHKCQQTTETIIDAPLEQINTYTEQKIDLLNIPAQRFTLAPIHSLATLYEAKKTMKQTQTDALYVVPPIAVTRHRPRIKNQSNTLILGIITRQAINTHYQI
jgi:CIC family chloride channel protein